ncbi:HAMP domain-containing histidine kinase [Flavobacterium sp. LS1R47]|uniref:histidine kinase n=1 Tax=Flavobacterium frigoritolerans TaxID=2987686 RepID=A0A9X2ZSQ6_9FLAO|nr:HAMP domain-containing sensor histidine kinase [Flavobacterium frigoritolerans]MCV9933758.1 HAMP domain-containing histidine kinase [Flavobacterium frigoritolerans]
MKRKIILLITGCILTVVALTCIQGYFICNTYELKKKEVKDVIRKQLLAFEDDPEFIAIEDACMEKSRDFVKTHKGKKFSKEDYFNYIKKNRDSLSAALSSIMDKKVNFKHKIGYSIAITAIFDNEGIKKDTVYIGKLLVLSNNIKSQEEFSLATGIWQTKISSSSEEDRDVYNIEIRSERNYSFDSLQKIILQEMIGLLVFSVLLITFVIILFYLSIRNLITQKKIADIKTDFINNITHEFNTPLAAMDIAVKTFELDTITEEQHKNTIAIIKRQNQRLQSIFSQVAGASLSSQEIAIDNNIASRKEIEEIIADFRLSYPNITISYSIDTATQISMKQFHLNTILINLLDNAVKYGADDIKLTCEQSEVFTTLSIEDNGRGIPENEQKNIFEKFYRIEKDNIHNTKGLGLGLFYVKQIVETYKGTISVKSIEKKGTLLLISIPL